MKTKERQQQMYSLLRNADRLLAKDGRNRTWLSFSSLESPLLSVGDAGIMTSFSETQLAPGRGKDIQKHEIGEAVIYVYKGVLALKNSAVQAGVVKVGEFQCMTINREDCYTFTNALRTCWTIYYHLGFRALGGGHDFAPKQKRFTRADRHNVLCVVASPDGQMNSLRTRQDAIVISSVLDSGKMLAHELLGGRIVCLHVICGEVAIHDYVLTQGDSLVIVKEPSVSLIAKTAAEILLVDCSLDESEPISGGVWSKVK